MSVNHIPPLLDNRNLHRRASPAVDPTAVSLTHALNGTRNDDERTGPTSPCPEHHFAATTIHVHHD